VTAAASTPVVPGYHIDRLIGEGGFGQVWCGTRDDGVRVAIKVLHLELVRSVDALTRFERELSAVQSLDHRSVVSGYGHGALPDGRPYLVLEYIEGPSLREVILARGSLSPVEMLDTLEPLGDALAAAHALGLVHRDVKASNVIMGHDAQGARPVLLDFGLVKLLGEDGPGLTSSRTMLGTPTAMAPEQMRGLPVDARTDVYALGALAFHMLTGGPPFGSAPTVVQSYLQMHGPRPRPSAKADLDPAIDEPIVRALSPDPASRFATPRELVLALRAVIAPREVVEVGAGELDVVALYVEGGDLAAAARVATAAGMTLAFETPDSLIAVAPRVDLGRMRAGIDDLVHGGAKVALGPTRATVDGDLVDGPALDVESWAPYPLAAGSWIAEMLRS
jgi:serine/threonine-protein kinase